MHILYFMEYISWRILIVDFKSMILQEKSTQTESQNRIWNEIKSSDLKIPVRMDFHRTLKFQKRKEKNLRWLKWQLGLTYEKDKKDAQSVHQRFKENKRSRGLLFNVRVREVLYRSSESTRDPSSPAKSTRGWKWRRRRGWRRRRTVAATWQVSHGRTLIEKKEDTREWRKGRERKKQGLVGRLRGMVGDSSLATCRGFFSPAVRTRLPSDIFPEFFAERFPVSITQAIRYC